MRRLAALLLILAPVLAACGSASPGGGSSMPAVSGGFGSDPLISLPTGKPPASLVVQTISQGSGPVVRASDYVMFEVAGKVWAGDRLVIDSFSTHQPQGLPLHAGLPAWRRLAGQHVGSRVMEIVPPKDGFGSHGDPSVNVTGSDTLVFVFDILAAVPASAHASGTVLPYHPAPGMPRVTGSAHGPVITVPPKTAAPAHLAVTTLIRGHGPPLLSGETVVTQFTGVLWRNGTVFDSSWLQGDPQAFVLGSSQVITGWDRGLAGQRVGSRVLLVIPPSLGYGKSGNPPTIRPTDTLVYVVDIIDAIHG